jgi:hypothetical protein
MVTLRDKHKTVKCHGKLGILRAIRCTLNKRLAIIEWYTGSCDAVGVEFVKVAELSPLDNAIAKLMAKEVLTY